MMSLANNALLKPKKKTPALNPMFSQYTAGQEECHRSLARDGPQTQSNGYQNQIRHQILISQSVANLEIYFQAEILKNKV